MNSQELLAKLVSFDTTSHLTNLPLIDFVARYLAQYGVESTVLPDATGKKANLWASLGPKMGGGLLLSGHTDVVPVDGQPWQTPPFDLRREGDQLFGRGTTDMKGFLACMLAAVPQFLSVPLRRPIHLALTFDEEIGCFGADELVAQLGVSLPMPEMAIVGEPSNMQAIIAHKGLSGYNTTITGKDVHSSLIHLGASSIRAAAEITQFLYAKADELAHGEQCDGMQLPPYSTINVGRIQGGQARNIVARETTLLWEYRHIPGADVQWAWQRLNEFTQTHVLPSLKRQSPQADVVTERVSHIPAFSVAPDTDIVKLVSQLTGIAGVSKVPYGAEAGQYAQKGISTVICGPGSIEQAHQPNEYLEISQLHACDAFMRQLAVWAQTVHMPAPARV
jgi:acetylornithine deacetylase